MHSEIRASSTTQSELRVRLDGHSPDSSFNRTTSGMLSKEIEAGHDAGFLAMMHAEITASSTVPEELQKQADSTDDFLGVSDTVDVGGAGDFKPEEQGGVNGFRDNATEAWAPHPLDNREEILE